jgi:signal transduction histidine kinase
MGTRAASGVAWSIWALAVSLAALQLLVIAMNGLPQESERLGDTGGVLLRVLYVLTVVLLATMGVLIASRHQGNAIGWLCCAWGLIFAAEMFASEYATAMGLASPGYLLPGAAWFAWVAQMLNIHIVLIVPVLLLFPDGRLPGRRWGLVVWLVVTSAVVSEALLAIRPGPLSSAPAIENPLGFAGLDPTFVVAYRVSVVGTVAAALLAATALGLRLRRARGDERQQIKWIAYAGVLLALAFLAGFSAPHEYGPIVQVLYFVVLDSFLLTLGLAILKYRLYEIDLVINKTLAYGALAVVIGLVYVLLVVGIGALVGTRGEPNLVLSLVATAIVAVAFEPLRQRLQRVANQLVYGHRLSPYEVLSEFSRRMAGVLSIDEVLPRLAAEAARGVGGQACRISVHVPGGEDRIVASPGEDAAGPFDRTELVLHHGAPVGEISVRKSRGQVLSAAESELLADLAAQAGPTLANLRLTFELQARLSQLATQAEELRASRQRIVAAQDAERRRVERDIHDGAQQHLVAIAINARLARQVLDQAPGRAGELLEEISTQVDGAIENLRDLARGIFPTVLADRGLIPALQAHLNKSASSARLDPDASVVRVRFDPRLEAAIYFCCLEALQNAAKHAMDAPVRVGLAAVDGWLTLQVCDEGPGFDVRAQPKGTGLQGMSDRLQSVGGTLEVASVSGTGTTVYGRVPLSEVAAPQAAESRLEPNSALIR